MASARTTPAFSRNETGFSRADLIETCARRAMACPFGFRCEHRGVQDMETGETPCSMENDGDGLCQCAERHDEAHQAALRVRAVGALTV